MSNVKLHGSLMENYSKGQNVEIEAEWSIPGFSESVTRLEITPSTRVKDIITVALDKMKTENQLLWVGSGPASLKVVSTAEIVKKRIKGLHQITQLSYKRVEEYWEPKLEGLDHLKVTREVPAVAILLSKHPLDSSTPGYQAPGSTGEELWLSEKQMKKKRPNNKTRNTKRQNFDGGVAMPSASNKNQNLRQGTKRDPNRQDNQRRGNRDAQMHKGKTGGKTENGHREHDENGETAIPQDRKEE